jgi:hypothetical protein
VALALALAFRGFLAGVGGDLEAARGYLGRALPLGRAVADAKTMGWVLHLQGMVLSGSREPDDLAAGRRALEEAVSVYRAAGDRHRAAEVLGDLGGSVAWRARESAVDAEAVRVMLEESARVLNELRDRRGAAFALRMLGELARWRGTTRPRAPSTGRRCPPFGTRATGSTSATSSRPTRESPRRKGGRPERRGCSARRHGYARPAASR